MFSWCLSPNKNLCKPSGDLVDTAKIPRLGMLCSLRAAVTSTWTAFSMVVTPFDDFNVFLYENGGFLGGSMLDLFHVPQLFMIQIELSAFCHFYLFLS